MTQLFLHCTDVDSIFQCVRSKTVSQGMRAGVLVYWNGPHRLLESKAMQEWLLAAESETEVIEREETGQ